MTSKLPTLSPTTSHPQRAPPPSLFLGPPSRNASNISLPGASSTSTAPRAPLLRARSTRGPDIPTLGGRSRPQQPAPPAQTEGDRTDALWAEMQATLADVELSAFSNNHVFGAAHSAALDELREAQIQLARAWGKRTADDDADRESQVDAGFGQKNATEGEEEDILVARRRRAQNEKFFSGVRDGVVDVVGKLEAVAEAMGKVERESRDIWTGSESVDSGSVTS